MVNVQFIAVREQSTHYRCGDTFIELPILYLCNSIMSNLVTIEPGQI